MPQYRVSGMDKLTKLPTEMDVTAETDVAARQAANSRGMIVSEVVTTDWEPSAPRNPHPEAEERNWREWQRLIQSPEHRALKHAVFVGALKALIVFFLLQVALVIVLTMVLRGT